MRQAAIDVGTNTILLLVAEVDGEKIRPLEDQVEITRLGEGVDRRGLLGRPGQERSLKALRSYWSRCRQLNVNEITVVGTSALREAANAAEFKARVKEDLGWEIRVLSREEEARYAFQAVYRGLDFLAEDPLVVDVGGGSTEIIWGKNGWPHRWTSLRLGTVRLTERYLPSDPVREEECARLSQAVERELETELRSWEPLPTFAALVGVGASFTTLVAVQRGLACYVPAEVHGGWLERKEIRRQQDLFQSRTIAQRKKIPGLDPGRADVILSGALLIHQIMARFRVERVQVSDHGIRHGVLYDQELEGPGSRIP